MTRNFTPDHRFEDKPARFARRRVECAFEVVCLAAMLAALAACAATEKDTFAAPRVDATVKYSAGSFDSGGAGSAAVRPDRSTWKDLEPDDCYKVRIDVHCIDVLPDAMFSSLASSAELILRYPTDDLIKFAPVLFNGARWGGLLDPDLFLAELERGDYGNSIPLKSVTAVLPPDVTTVFRIADVFADSHPIDGTAFHRRVEFRIQRGSARSPADAGADRDVSGPATAVRCILAMENLAPARAHDGISGYGSGNDGERSSETRIPMAELVLMPVESGGLGRGWGTFFYSPFAGSPKSALAAVIRIEPIASGADPGADIESALESCLAAFEQGGTVDYVGSGDYTSYIGDSGLADVSAAGTEAPGEIPPGGDGVPGFTPGNAGAEFDTILGYVDMPVQRRSAMMYILTSLGTHIALDLALTGSDEVITALSQAIIDERKGAAGWDAANLGWTVERAACRFLTQASTRSDCPPEFIGLLALHTGALCRNPWTMEDILDSADGFEAFRKMVVDENVLMLQDRSPSNRSRAFVFLQGQGVALGDYEPLAPRRERRKALMQILSSDDTDLDAGGEEQER